MHFPYVQIEYRASMHAWRAVGYDNCHEPFHISSWGSLRRARQKGREWLKRQGPVTVFETLR